MSINKIQDLHADKFGQEGISDYFYSLINRLRVCSETKYPNMIWSTETYYSIAFEWIGKEAQLLRRVTILEKEIGDNEKTKP